MIAPAGLRLQRRAFRYRMNRNRERMPCSLLQGIFKKLAERRITRYDIRKKFTRDLNGGWP